MKSVLRLIISFAMIMLIALCSKSKLTGTNAAQDANAKDLLSDVKDRDKCLQAAQKVFGPSGELLKCGHFNNAAILETVVATRVPGLKDDKLGIPVTKLMILRWDKFQWNTELSVDKEIANGAGYVGFNFIDDTHRYPYFRVNFTDRGAKWGGRSASQFTLVFISMTRVGKVDSEDLGLGIGWNPAVGRYQELEPNGEVFVPEVSSPKHIRN
jgi:hypothetical protein